MKKFEAKKQIKSRVYSKFTLLGLLIIMILLMRGVYTLYERNRESALMRNDAEIRLKELNDRKQMVSGEIVKLNNSEGVEEEIREKFNVVKPGEKVVIIVPEEEATTTVESEGFVKTLWHKVWK